MRFLSGRKQRNVLCRTVDPYVLSGNTFNAWVQSALDLPNAWYGGASFGRSKEVPFLQQVAAAFQRRGLAWMRVGTEDEAFADLMRGLRLGEFVEGQSRLS